MSNVACLFPILASFVYKTRSTPDKRATTRTMDFSVMERIMIEVKEQCVERKDIRGARNKPRLNIQPATGQPTDTLIDIFVHF